MAIATVSIKFVNPPKGNSKFGSINTEELGFVGVKEDELVLFSKGNTYSIEYTEKGRFKDFVRFADGERPRPTATSTTAHAPAPVKSNGSDLQSRMIFVTGVVGRMAGSGAIGATDIKGVTLAANEAYEALLIALEKRNSPY